MRKILKTAILMLMIMVSLTAATGCDGAKDYHKIDNAMASTKARNRLPIDVGNGIKWTGMERENGYVVFSYSVNEDPITPEMMIASMNANPDAIKAQMQKDPITPMAKEAGLGFKMIYTGEKSGSKAEFTIECGDL